MVKSVLSVSHLGLREWIYQRVSAIIMAIYSIALIIYILFYPGLSFVEWHHLFSHDWMKIATIIFILSIMAHAWVGMWTIFTDYVPTYVLRCVLNLLVLLMLTACFMWAVLILWSV